MAVVESLLGAIFSMFCSIFFLSLPTILFFFSGPRAALSIAVPIVTIVGAAEIWFLFCVMSRVVRFDGRMALGVAAMQPTYPRALRPVVAVFWALHVIFPLFSLLVVIPGEIRTLSDACAMAGFLMAWSAGLLYAANVFALLAIVAVTNSNLRAEQFWAKRWWWDSLIGILVVAFGVGLRHLLGLTP
jgi:hypothetical protein